MPTVKIALESEPAFVAVGPKCVKMMNFALKTRYCVLQNEEFCIQNDELCRCVACGMNNRVWFYSIETRQLINDKEYHGTVSQVQYDLSLK